MDRTARYRLNAVICLLVLAHAVYRFFGGNVTPGLNLWTTLIVAQGLLGLGGAVWFWTRSRGTA